MQNAASRFPYQPLAVEQGSAAARVNGPVAELEHVVDLLGQLGCVLVLRDQSPVPLLGHTLDHTARRGEVRGRHGNTHTHTHSQQSHTSSTQTDPIINAHIATHTHVSSTRTFTHVAAPQTCGA